MLAGTVGIALNALLCLFKLIAGTVSGSIAITADALNNLSDAGSSLIMLIGFKLSAKKPDPHHPFGHGRIEYLTGLIVSFLIMLMGFELFKSSVGKILNPERIVCSPLTAGILIASIAVKGYMFAYNRTLSRRLSSPAMEATAADSRSDVLATALILAAMLISHFTSVSVDGWAGLIMSATIMYAGFCAARDTVSPLLGQAPDPELVENIRKRVLDTPDVIGIHDLIVHDYGPGRRMVSLHAEVPASGNMLTLHNSLDKLERQLKGELGCDAVIHMDPIETDDERIAPLEKQISDLIQSRIDKNIQLHDFRMIVGVRHVNIIFDAVAPFNFRLSDEQLRCAIIALMHEEIDETLHIIVQIDHDMTM
jgi:cation diffusion facilitator family transporter